MKIIFITTGGTIDKDYASKAQTYNFEIAKPAVSRILKTIRPNFDFKVISILKKDSLDITDNDRQLIFDTCKDVQNDKIIITHGTDTMVKTAKKLSSIKGKKIILVGASKPERFKDSDAAVNIGVAIGAVNCLKAGVYITMNGRVYDWNNCEKRRDGLFVCM